MVDCERLPAVRVTELKVDEDALNYEESIPTESNSDAGGFAQRSDLRPYATVFGAFLGLFCTFGQLNSFGVFQAWYSTHQLQDRSPSDIAWIGSIQLFMFFLSGGFVGRLFDAYGPRILIIFGAVTYVVSIMLVSACRSYLEFILAQGFLLGTGVGIIFYPSIAAVSTHFDKYRATAIGIALCGSSLGGVVFPIVIRLLFNTVGFGWAVRISGFISLALCSISVLTVGNKHNERNPNLSHSNPFISECIKDVKFITLCAGCFVVAFGIFIPYIYIVDYSIHQEVASTTAFYTLSAMNGGSVIGRILPGYLSDRCGRFNLLIPSALFSGLFCFLLCTPSDGSASIIMILSVLYGLFSGAFISLINPCVFQISERLEFGTRMGLLYSFIALPTLLGSPVSGILLRNNNQSFKPVLLLAGASLTAGTCILIVTRLLVSRKIMSKV